MFRAIPRLSRNATALGAAGAAFGAIGLLQQSNTPSRQQSSATSVGLDPKGWTPLTLTNIKKLTANTAIYRFAYSDPEATSGMSVASLLMVKAPIGSTKKDGSRANVLRPYTPITRPEQPGYLELAVKTYPDGKSEHQRISTRAPSRNVPNWFSLQFAERRSFESRPDSEPAHGVDEGRRHARLQGPHPQARV